jgi:hypothetical protein
MNDWPIPVKFSGLINESPNVPLFCVSKLYVNPIRWIALAISVLGNGISRLNGKIRVTFTLRIGETKAMF